MKPIRLLAALLALQNAFPAPALAAVIRAAAPVPVAALMPGIPVLPAALGSLSAGPAPLTLSPRLAPVLMGVTLPDPRVAATGALLPSAVAAQAASAKPAGAPRAAVPSVAAAIPAPATARNRAPAALAAALTAAGIAGEVASTPSTSETDSSRLDFPAAAERRGLQEKAPVAAAAPTGRRSGLLRSFRDSRRAPPSASPAPRLRALQSGTFGAQVASNSLQVTMPLLLLHLSGSAAFTAFAATLASALDAAGTVLGGWLVDRVGSRRVLIGTTAVRGAVVLSLPLLALGGGLSIPLVAAAYLAESLARGAADTARNTVPSEIAGKDEVLLRRILSANQIWFEAGSITGPLLAGLLISGAGGASAAGALWLAPAAFTAVFFTYLGLPSRQASPAPAPVPGPDKPGFDTWTRWALAATALLTLYPLKGLLPAVFAEQVLRDPASGAWLVGLFGVGGLLGSLSYRRLSGRAGLKTWLTAGAAGTLALAAAFLPGAFLPAALGIVAFGAANGAARLSLNAAIQARAPEGKAGAVVGAARFTANASSLGVRFLSGLAFSAVAVPGAAFWLLAAGMGAAAAGQLWTARRLAAIPAAAPAPSPMHGFPGRLIAVEGLDGSGKSTQLELLKEQLESQGLKVVLTSWNSSDLLSDTVKKAKQERALTPATFALLNAADFAERTEAVIKPALREGAVVLADRWFFTALARDSVRGNDPKWLRGLYAGSLRPDLSLYFKLPVETAIGRVLKRAEGRLGLSEDFSEKAPARVLGQNFYAVGRDMRFADDDRENFLRFQTKVAASYDRQAREFGFRLVDATKPREVQQLAVQAQLERALGPLSALATAGIPGAKKNLFDKDPAGDADNIRHNYMHDKRGAHFYFRNMLLPMQERFAQLMEMSAMPRVFLHGSPHLDNYAKSRQGAAMVDFDRARVGPYAWDLVRLMVSISLRRKKAHADLLDAEVLKQLKKGYLRGFRHPDRPFSEARLVKDVEPAGDETSTDAYLAADKKWAHEMRSRPLARDDPDVTALVRSWSAGRGDGALDEYFVEEAGRGQGSMGFRDIFLVVLAPKDARSGQDRILLNFKRTRTDPDTEWYKSPYPAEAERMAAASDLYAPDWERYNGGAILADVEYYVHQIDPQNAKIKKMLDKEQQADFAYAVGTQLGRAHRLSLQEGATAAGLEAHLAAHFDDIVAAGLTIRDEVVEAHARYLRELRRRGLA